VDDQRPWAANETTIGKAPLVVAGNGSATRLSLQVLLVRCNALFLLPVIHRPTVQPHNSVADTSFYKHIDVDQPDVERLRQLLIWCTARASSTSSSSSSSTLPPLSDKAAKTLKSVQDDMMKMLADKDIDLSPAPTSSEGKKKENAQNVSNRRWEITYSEQIRKSAF
jgi:hypothetical protein